MKTFGDTLTEVMNEHGITQTELSEKSGIYPSYISRLRSNSLLDPTISKATALIHALNMSLDEFSNRQECDDWQTLAKTRKTKS